MTQRNIYVMDVIVDKISSGEKLSSALKAVYSKRHLCIPYDETKLETHVVELGLSMRTTNALMRSGLNNVGKIIEFCNTKKITSIPNLGKTSGIELFEKILDYFWDNMSNDDREWFLIDIVNRNSDHICAEII